MFISQVEWDEFSLSQVEWDASSSRQVELNEFRSNKVKQNNTSLYSWCEYPTKLKLLFILNFHFLMKHKSLTCSLDDSTHDFNPFNATDNS